MEDKDINIIAETNFRNKKIKFGIKVDDRRQHIYMIGKTGMGKTALLENMIIHDIKQGGGVALIDPHGDTAKRLLNFIPPEREKDVIYFSPADINFPIAFNPLEAISDKYHHLIASGILDIFKKIWPDVWNSRMEYILNNCLMALLEYPNSTLLDIMRLLSDDSFRSKVVTNLKDPVIKSFWLNEFGSLSDNFQAEAISPIQNKVGQFLTNPVVRNIIGQRKSSFNFREVMDGQKIFIANLSRGLVGQSNSTLLGAMLVTKIQQAAMSRADIPEEKRKDFFLYADEFQTFATESFSEILSEARKYRLSLVISHQYISQLPDKVRAAIFGNVGTFIVFRVGPNDAKFLTEEFSTEFTASDLVELANYNIYIKLMIDGVPSKCFSAETFPPLPIPKEEGLTWEEIIECSRKKYASPLAEVEGSIKKEWSDIVEIK